MLTGRGGRVDRFERAGKMISTIFVALIALMFAYGYLGWLLTG
jgi:hypothetical protein